MKFTATFAVLAVFATKAVVLAAPTHGYDALVEARSEFVESALEEVWARFCNELLEDIEARDYDEEIFERSPMKKFATDLATNLAQKAPQYAQQYSQSQEAKARNSQPKMAQVVQKAQAQAKGSAAKPIAAVKPLPANSKWNTVKQPSVMAEIKKLGKPSVLDKTKGAFGKRSLDDIEDHVFERSPMKKFATDVVTNLAQKAPQYAQQYSQSQEAKARNSQPRFAQVVQQAQNQAKGSSSRPAVPKLPANSKWNTVKKPSVMAEIKKLRKD
ncbi:hypothetical protein BKA70DRAFT_1315914 [Coprinopsis sp. MPI-PUGE-AT-0042]|nr:hypothetical protein BKA70DRAFT_1315914 [Coprinopsis sp. MPI-PUGE-AT-0042]